METHVRAMLEALGEDPAREGLVKTPDRVARALREMTRGYTQDPEAIVRGALFTEEYSEMIVMKDIDFYSMCEHHMLPFFGKAHIAYIPKGKIVGISKLARIVDVFSRRLQVQERMTKQVADLLMDVLKPEGVAVVVEGEHLCMRMRGVEKQNSYVSTSALLGVFRDHQATRDELMTLIASSKRA